MMNMNDAFREAAAQRVRVFHADLGQRFGGPTWVFKYAILAFLLVLVVPLLVILVVAAVAAFIVFGVLSVAAMGLSLFQGRSSGNDGRVNVKVRR
jgi:hypothetical protein